MDIPWVLIAAKSRSREVTQRLCVSLRLGVFAAKKVELKFHALKSPDDKCSDALVGIETFIVSDQDADQKRRHATQQELNRRY